MDIPIRFRRAAFASVLALLLSSACVTVDPAQEEAARLIRNGDFEQGIARLEQVLKEDPGNVRARADLLNARANAVNRFVAAAQAERGAGRADVARGLYERALAIEPASEQARAGLDELRRDQRHAEIIKGARAAFEKGDIESAQTALRAVLVENPQHAQAQLLRNLIDERRMRELMAGPKLEAAFRRTVNLEFHDAGIKLVFDALSRSTGINYILDKDIRPDLRTTIVSRQAPLEDAIDLILMTSQLAKKVLGPNAILIYPATPQKLKEYQDLVVKSFYLTSADVKQTQNLLKSVLKTRDIFIDEKLNLLVIRDTPEGVRLAEKLIAIHDIGEREVMLELEVLEVRRSRLLDLGIQWPDQLTLTPLPSTGSTVTLRDLQNLNSGNIGATLSSAIINLKKQDGDVNLLANPRVRARNKEKARILIGERVPVITTTATSTGFVSQNIQYLDVGLKLEIEPEVYLDGDVGMKVALEVSAITREILTSTGLLTYQVGTRNAATSLRLKDGETQILAGLINDEDRRTANRVPGLGDMPVVGRLFGSQRDDQQKTEIVLSITPRLVRGLNRPDATASEFWSGTEATPRTRPILLGSVSPKDGQTLAIAPVGSAAVAIGRAPGTSASGQAFLSLRAPETVKIGQEFSVDLSIKSDLPLRALPFQVGFDPTALQVVDVREGAFFQQGGAKTSFASNIDAKAGRIFVGLTRTGAGGAKGEDRLVTITFRAQSANAKSELRLLAATPVAAGSAAITVALPQPAAISVTR